MVIVDGGSGECVMVDQGQYRDFNKKNIVETRVVGSKAYIYKGKVFSAGCKNKSILKVFSTACLLQPVLNLPFKFMSKGSSTYCLKELALKHFGRELKRLI